MSNLFKNTGGGTAFAIGGIVAAGWYFSTQSLLSGTALQSISVLGAIGLAGAIPMWLSNSSLKKTNASETKLLSQRLMALDRHVLVNVVDTNGILTEVNDQMLAVTGYEADALIGQPVSMLYTQDEGRLLANTISNSLCLGRTWQGETPLRCSDGSIIVTHSTIIPLFDQDGKWSGSISARTDITQMTKLMGEHETVETLDELRDDIWILDAVNEKFTYMNKAALARMKWSRRELAQKGLIDLSGLTDGLDMKAICDDMRNGGETLRHIEVTMSGVPFHVTIKYLKVGNQADRFLFLLNNISQRLEEERTKSDFIAMVSHELRSPLTSIKGSMGLLLSKAAGELPDKAEALLEIAHRNADRLVLIINDILDLEKISSGRMEFELSDVELSSLVCESSQANEMLLQRYGLKIQMIGTDSAIPMHTDPNRIMQVLNNLISNACKFSPAGGKVTICVEDRAEDVKIEVKDQGAGIPVEDQHKIFQRFADLQNSDRTTKGGTGLGLSICKAIVESLGGRIGFESNVGEGTNFYFVLPKPLGFGNEEHVVSEMRKAS